MRKNVFGRKFKRDINERKALFKSLISSLILKGRIQTTLEKAKAIKGDLDKIVNKAKKGELEAKYYLQPLFSENIIKKLTTDIVPMLSNINSGYTRMVKTGRRFSDNAQMVFIEWAGERNKISNIKNQKLETREKVQAKETETQTNTKRGRNK